jgi:hypothetical protein
VISIFNSGSKKKQCGTTHDLAPMAIGLINNM